MQTVSLRLTLPRQLIFAYNPNPDVKVGDDLPMSSIFTIDPGEKMYAAQIWELVKKQNAKQLEFFFATGDLEEVNPIDLDDTQIVGGLRVDSTGSGEPVPVSTKVPTTTTTTTTKKIVSP